MLLVIHYAPRIWNQLLDFDTLPGLIYICTYRTIWAICLAYVIYTCANGQGGPINAIFSWKPFILLSRLTFQTTFINWIVINWFLHSIRQTVYISHTYMV